jgi:GMP synthase-like glutamine amidotransferase
MYKKQSIFKHLKIKEKFLEGLRNEGKGTKAIFRKWDDVEGIRDVLKRKKIDGIILSGSDYFVDCKKNSSIDKSILLANIPILAICYGFQSLIHTLGKPVYIKRNKNGYMNYVHSLRIPEPFAIPKHKYYFYHTNYIVKVPNDFQILTKIKNKIIVAYNSKKNILGVQFHPEKYKKTLRIILHTWITKCVTA